MESAVTHFCAGGKEYVGGRVDTGLAGILDNADDETDADDLHGNVVRNVKETAGEWDQKQGSASDARRTCCAGCCKHTHDERCAEGNFDAESGGSSESHCRNGDGCAGHVNSRTERNRNGIGVFIKLELFAEFHVNWNVRC